MKKSLPYVIRFLGATGGNFAASRESEGLDVYSPIPGTRAAGNVELIGFGASIKNIVKNIHMCSIKRRKRNISANERYPFDRLSCTTIAPVGGNRGSWWSFPVLDFQSPEHRNLAMQRLIEENPTVVDNLFTIDEIRNECNRLIETKDPELGNAALNAQRVLKSLESVHVNADRVLPHMLNDQPLRFDLDASLILYWPSSSPQDPKGYYTNVSNEARQAIGRMPTPPLTMEEPLGD